MGENQKIFKRLRHMKSKERYTVMQDKMNSLHENHNYDLVKLSNAKRELKSKWVYKSKPEEDG